MGWLSKPASPQVPTPAKADVVQDNHDDPDSPKSQPGSPWGSPKPAIVQPTNGTSDSSAVTSNNGTVTLPPNVEIRACTKDDIKSLKRLTGLLLPIQYPETFYREILDDPITNNITLLAIWHTTSNKADKDQAILIGAIRCRLLANPPSLETSKEGPMLYLSTLVLLSPYRNHGIATHMLNMLTRRAVRTYDVTSVGAHVWEANLDGLEWYRKRGFWEVGREVGYYRRLKHGTAVVMQRKVGVMDLVGG